MILGVQSARKMKCDGSFLYNSVFDRSANDQNINDVRRNCLLGENVMGLKIRISFNQLLAFIKSIRAKVARNNPPDISKTFTMIQFVKLSTTLARKAFNLLWQKSQLGTRGWDESCFLSIFSLSLSLSPQHTLTHSFARTHTHTHSQSRTHRDPLSFSIPI